MIHLKLKVTSTLGWLKAENTGIVELGEYATNYPFPWKPHFLFMKYNTYICEK